MNCMLRSFARGAWLLVALLAASLVNAATITTFTYPGAATTNGWGINNALRVAASASLPATPDDQIGSVYDFSTNTFTNLPAAPAGFSATALGINDAGVLVGSMFNSTTFNSSGFVLTGSTYVTFDFPGADSTTARAINNAGLVTGYANLPAGGAAGFIYNPATLSFTDITVPGSIFMIAQGINTAGVIVGSAIMPAGTVYAGSPGGQYGFVRQPGGTFTLFRINGVPTRARSINDAGRIAGWLTDTSDGVAKAFVVTVPAIAAFETVSLPTSDYIALAGAELTVAEGINNAGYVSGSAYYPDGTSVGFVIGAPVVQQIDDTVALITSFGIHHGTENALLAKLNAARAAVLAGNISAACGSLQALINQANAQAGKKLTVSQANQIVAAANAMRTALGC